MNNDPVAADPTAATGLRRVLPEADVNLCQYNTPLWLAESLVERYFPQLDMQDFVIEPSCGPGSFLSAIPSHVPAVGVEIDPRVAAVARTSTGRDVLVGDFRTVHLAVRPTAVLSNPPFRVRLIEQFLQRAHQLLPENGRAGFLLPAYALQSSRRVSAYADLWSLAVEIIPRDCFPRLREPIVFALFTKDLRRTMVGIALVHETADVSEMREPYRSLLRQTHGGLWRPFCKAALARLGGEADLGAIYAEIEGVRPTRNPFWREKVRQTLRLHTDTFQPVRTARYALVHTAQAA